MAGQPLRGFVGQSMSGKRPTPRRYQTVFSIGTSTFPVPYSGKWKLVAWGCGGISGGSGGAGGASGAYVEISRFLTKGQVVTVVVPSFAGGSTQATTITLPDGSVASAGPAITTAPGAATGGDVNLAGTAGASAGANDGSPGLGTGGGAGGLHFGGDPGGAGAPANSPFRGGAGGGGATQAGIGAGGGGASTGANPGPALAVAIFVGGNGK